MFSTKPYALEEYVFNNSVNGLLTGGYPMEEFIKNENNNYKMLGGSTKDNNSDNSLGIGIARFKNLVIPTGLVSFSVNSNHAKYDNRNKKKTDEIDVISTDMFDKLFEKITHKRVNNKTYSRKIRVKSAKNETKRSH